jgi:hypothetical protein
MIVSTNEFYIPAFVLKWSAKVNQFLWQKNFFLFGILKPVNEKPSASTNQQRALE